MYIFIELHERTEYTLRKSIIVHKNFKFEVHCTDKESINWILLTLYFRRKSIIVSVYCYFAILFVFSIWFLFSTIGFLEDALYTWPQYIHSNMIAFRWTLFYMSATESHHVNHRPIFEVGMISGMSFLNMTSSLILFKGTCRFLRILEGS